MPPARLKRGSKARWKSSRGWPGVGAPREVPERDVQRPREPRDLELLVLAHVDELQRSALRDELAQLRRLEVADHRAARGGRSMAPGTATPERSSTVGAMCSSLKPP